MSTWSTAAAQAARGQVLPAKTEGGEGAGDREVTAAERSLKLFYFLQKCYIRPMFETLPYEPRQLQATEDRLHRIYKAAKLGLKGDNLALAAGMLPKEYARLKQFDEIAEYAELKGRAEGELEMSHLLHDAAAQGDAKAALAILQNVHGWVAKQAITVDVNQSISITAALQEAERRVIDVIENNPSQVLQHADHTLQRAG